MSRDQVNRVMLQVLSAHVRTPIASNSEFSTTKQHPSQHPVQHPSQPFTCRQRRQHPTPNPQHSAATPPLPHSHHPTITALPPPHAFLLAPPHDLHPAFATAQRLELPSATNHPTPQPHLSYAQPQYPRFPNSLRLVRKVPQ